MTCSDNPYVEHGFDRNGSHMEGRYVCECENVNVKMVFNDWLSYVHSLDGEVDVDILEDLVKHTNAYKWQLENGDN